MLKTTNLQSYKYALFQRPPNNSLVNYSTIHLIPSLLAKVFENLLLALITRQFKLVSCGKNFKAVVLVLIVTIK